MNTLPNTLSSSQADKDKLLDLLRSTRQRFLASFAGVTEEQSRRRPVEGSWSVADCVEHVAAAETFMLRLVQGQRQPRPAGAKNREEIFLERMTDRTTKIKSPEGARPTGRFGSMEAAGKQFETSRAGTIRFVEESTDDLRATGITHPHPLFGEVSAYEWVIIMAKHAERHALQIEEIKRTLRN
jgi:DinB superfamily